MTATISGYETAVRLNSADGLREGDYVFRGVPTSADHAKDIKTTIRCPICQLRFLRRLHKRPIGRVAMVTGPVATRQLTAIQPAMLHRLPRSLTVLYCSSKVCRGMYFTVPHKQFRAMNAATGKRR